MSDSDDAAMRAVLVGAADPGIVAAEARIRAAQLAANVAALDELIADELLFTGPDGQLGTKAADLAAHRSGAVRFRAHEPEELRVRAVGPNVAVAALRARLAVEVGGQLIRGTYRYTRVWAREAGGEPWRVVAGHVSAVAEMPHDPTAPRILEWRPADRPDLRAAFERLSREWIEGYFAVEPRDEAVFRDPAGTIVAPGGAIFFLLEGDTPVGTCAMIPEGAGVYQLGKLGVTAAARGRGYGDRLLAHAIGWASARGARRVTLLTNTTLTAAGALYRKHGFRSEPFTAAPGYERTNARMALDLHSVRGEPPHASGGPADRNPDLHDA